MAEGYRVSSIPNLPKAEFDQFGNYAGVITVDEKTNSTLFFWLVTPKDAQPAKRPLILWLNGGPGCSSMDGLWLENGPYRVVEGSGGSKVVINRPNWVEEVGPMLFLDQPVGTGFSSTADRAALSRTEKAMAANVITFLTKWFALFADYTEADFYIAGESFAGTYIPYISAAILDHNAGLPSRRQFKLKGIAIGNGWVDPVAGYSSYIPFADENTLWLPDSCARADAVKNLETCLLQQSQKPIISSYPSCEAILQDVIDGTKEVSPSGKCLNLYDIRLEDTNPYCNGMSWPPGVDDMRAYLVRGDVVNAIHVTGSPRTPVWDECNDQVYAALDRDTTSAFSVTLVPRVVEAGVRVLLFSGKSDLICNWRGTQSLIANLTWAGATGFSPSVAEVEKEFVVKTGEVAGFWQHERNLTFVVINEASHMVPFDKPGESAEMMKRFVDGGFGESTKTTASRTASASVSATRTRLPTSTVVASTSAVVTSTAAPVSSSRPSSGGKLRPIFGGLALTLTLMLL
jgi:carboxypeptidase D